MAKNNKADFQREYKSKEEYSDLKLEFFSEYAANGGNATQAALKIGIPGGTGRKWAIARENQIELSEKKPSQQNKINSIMQSGETVQHWDMGGPTDIIVISDAQIKPNQCQEFIRAIAKEICAKEPAVILQIGDWTDFQSLSSYDFGKKAFEGRRYKADVEWGNKGIDIIENEIAEHNIKRAKKGLAPYKPLKIHTKGNHEHRVERAVNDNPQFAGIISSDDIKFKEAGWHVYEFLKVVTVNGVAFSHYFTSGPMGRPVASAKALITKKHMSCVMGHVQKDEIATDYDARGRRLTGLFTGCTYEHDEDYLGPQGNNYWRGIWRLHEVMDGQFEVKQISLRHLKQKWLSVDK